jgi:hypothetical protein
MDRVQHLLRGRRFQFHENEAMRNMANGLVDKYFGEDYGLE